MEELKLIPVLWSAFPDVDVVKPIGTDDEAVLREVREVLGRHGALGRFGISLIHRHFGLNDGEVLLESTDREARRQTVEVKPAAEVFGGGRVLGTQWVFDCSNENLVCRSWCHYDQGHKTNHQWSACNGNLTVAVNGAATGEQLTTTAVAHAKAP
jgi:hypothetical protein